MRVIIFGFILSLFTITDGNSCSCSKVNIKKAFKNSDLIFTGKVVKVKPLNSMDTVGVSDSGDMLIVEYSRVEFTFEIQNQIKGNKQGEKVTIITTGGGADCGNYFELGTEHLVYAYSWHTKLNMSLRNHNVEPFFTTSLCSRTKELNKSAKQEVKKLFRMVKRSR